MGRAMRKATVSIGLILSLSANAQCPAETTLFFGNGILNSWKSASESLDQLQSRISESENWKRERSHLAYNYDETAAYKLLEVYEQKVGDFDKQFWRWMWDWTDAPSWLQDQVKTLQGQQDLEGLQGYSLSEQISQYEHEMDMDRSIVVVAHSQGNFFANNASLLLQNAFYPATTDFKIVSVATPASFVNDDGPYFTLKSDGVIRWVPGALPPNISNESPNPGLFDHRFVDHYLNGVPTGAKIIDVVQTTFKRLADDAKKDEEYNAECWHWFESLRLPKDESQQCVLKCNVAKNDLSNFTCNQLCEAYCQCAAKRATVGTAN